MIPDLLFYVAAAALVAASAGVVMSKSPLHSALHLIAALCALAGLFVLLDASFVAAMQVLVYAGAIMVLFVFVIMLLNLQPGQGFRPSFISLWKILGVGSVACMGYWVIGNVGVTAEGTGALDGSVKNIGRLLLTQHLFAFEAVSILLLVAVVGAVVLGLKRLV